MDTNDSFEGDWVNDNKHGKGIFSYANGSKYSGTFVDNQKESGVLEMESGDEYAGSFKDDLFDGYSLYKYKNGDQYCGDFLKGKRHG